MAVCAEPSQAHGDLDASQIEFKCAHESSQFPTSSECTAFDVTISEPSAQSGVAVASRDFEYGQVLHYLSCSRKEEQATLSVSDQTEPPPMDPHAHQREMIAQMSALSGALAPHAAPTPDGKHLLVSPRGIQDMMMFEFETGTSQGLGDTHPPAAVHAAEQQVRFSACAPLTRDVTEQNHFVQAAHSRQATFGSLSVQQPNLLSHSVPEHNSGSAPSNPPCCSGGTMPECASGYPVKDEVGFARETGMANPRVPLGVVAHSEALAHVPVAATQYPTRSVIVPPSNFTQDQITPWLDDSSPSSNASLGNGSDTVSPQACADVAKTENASSSKLRGPVRKVGGSSTSVMPPTAKSILERRERAIREGRRHEAKLTDEERRILRRLRNRESAERCAKRKHEQADMLARKISSLERENRELRTLASQYEHEISKLERFLMSRPINHTNHSWNPSQ